MSDGEEGAGGKLVIGRGDIQSPGAGGKQPMDLEGGESATAGALEVALPGGSGVNAGGHGIGLHASFVLIAFPSTSIIPRFAASISAGVQRRATSRSIPSADRLISTIVSR